ncbi:SDR family NAD(P)-dependent oxidoreductase [Alphaproteobacteria bacterium LSUCC0684]
MIKDSLLVVTGGNRGIGRQVALSAVDAGWRVAISYGQNRQLADEMVAGSNGRMKAFALDVSNPDSVTSFFACVESEMGSASALVTAAGIDKGPRSIAEIDHEFVHSTMAINVVGLILCCREFAARAIKKGEGGVVVNVSSMAATIGGRSLKSVYAASKGAVDVFTIGAAKELAPHGISMFSVRPGVTRTDMTGDVLADPVTKASIEASIACGKVAEPVDIATPVIELISGKFKYASGSLINLGGGGFVI